MTLPSILNPYVWTDVQCERTLTHLARPPVFGDRLFHCVRFSAFAVEFLLDQMRLLLVILTKRSKRTDQSLFTLTDIERETILLYFVRKH